MKYVEFKVNLTAFKNSSLDIFVIRSSYIYYPVFPWPYL